jgi:hypothetical protein
MSSLLLGAAAMHVQLTPFFIKLSASDIVALSSVYFSSSLNEAVIIGQSNDILAVDQLFLLHSGAVRSTHEAQLDPDPVADVFYHFAYRSRTHSHALSLLQLY